MNRKKQWSNYRKISKGAHTIEVPKVRKQGTKSRGGGVWGLLRTIGDSMNVELGRDDFGLEEYKGLRNNELRAPKVRSHSRLGGLGSVESSPQRGLGRIPSLQRILEHFRSNEACFCNIFSDYSFTRIY